MIIWSGIGGILSGVLIVACLVLTQLSVNTAKGDDHYYQDRGWPKFVALCLAAPVTLALGLYMNRTSERVPVGPESYETVSRTGGGHSLFFIPIQYLCIPLIVIGIITLAK